MSTSTQDIFGAAPAAAPATPGSYGEPSAAGRLPDATRLGAVRLQVADLARSRDWYTRVLGLRVLADDGAGATLGAHADDAPLVTLVARPGARPMAARGRLGLYHFAILLPDRAALGRFVRHLGESGVRAGAGDHLVSEAFYLTDPDGLGIEVYADRPRETWRRVGKELMMATDPVDVPGLVAAAGGVSWTGMPAGTVMGHVHLHVGDVDAARAFYAEGLGFDRTVWHYPGALFLGAGGYHHHLGTNTWAGPGARPPAADDARLLDWTIVLPAAADVDAVAGRLERAGYATRRDGDALLADDPWGTTVRITL
ncbi:VOC family protein [Roseisolibacter sp. H3M3-2]|uniref:VOC family protein n=1 Tax=Roseisolibacter sp. H3M3-2 TaxID=3031323 RepID=UPI0023DB1323|nr:VOC family protein [Roseisolibacter sp. H3M3-2]MDF1505477.1 VOC family protein [Roseisolibacter sp. H3M3-2]